MDRAHWTAALVGFLAPVALLAPFSVAEAGLLDWLFGRSAPAVVRPAHPDITLSPRARADHRSDLRGARRRAPVQTAGRKAPPARIIDPRDTLAQTIDPEKTPDWWRRDPTLKRGDILFLDDRVVVFVGKKPGALSDYVPVAQTRLVSAKQRRDILAMAGSGAAKPRVAARPKPKRERERLASLR